MLGFDSARSSNASSIAGCRFAVMHGTKFLISRPEVNVLGIKVPKLWIAMLLKHVIADVVFG